MGTLPVDIIDRLNTFRQALSNCIQRPIRVCPASQDLLHQLLELGSQEVGLSWSIHHELQVGNEDRRDWPRIRVHTRFEPEIAVGKLYYLLSLHLSLMHAQIWCALICGLSEPHLPH